MAIHDSFVALMSRLVQKNGRTVSIRRQTGSTLRDPANPHLGATPDFSDTSTKAVFLDTDLRDLLLMLPGQPDQLTTVAREIDRMVLVPASGLSFELTEDMKIVDNGKVWEITQLAKIQPGPTIVGYVARVSN